MEQVYLESIRNQTRDIDEIRSTIILRTPEKHLVDGKSFSFTRLAKVLQE